MARRQCSVARPTAPIAGCRSLRPQQRLRTQGGPCETARKGRKPWQQLPWGLGGTGSCSSGCGCRSRLYARYVRHHGHRGLRFTVSKPVVLAHGRGNRCALPQIGLGDRWHCATRAASAGVGESIRSWLLMLLQQQLLLHALLGLLCRSGGHSRGRGCPRHCRCRLRTRRRRGRGGSWAGCRSGHRGSGQALTLRWCHRAAVSWWQYRLRNVPWRQTRLRHTRLLHDEWRPTTAG